MKTPEELKEELKNAANSVEGDPDELRCPLAIGNPGRDRAARGEYSNWWRDACDRLQGRTPAVQREAGPEPIEAVVSEADEVIETKRTFYDSSKGLVMVYEATPRVKLPIFTRRPDGHLGAVE